MRQRCEKCGRSYDRRDRFAECPHALKPREGETQLRRAIFHVSRRTHVIVGDHTPEPRRV